MARRQKKTKEAKRKIEGGKLCMCVCALEFSVQSIPFFGGNWIYDGNYF